MTGGEPQPAHVLGAEWALPRPPWPLGPTAEWSHSPWRTRRLQSVSGLELRHHWEADGGEEVPWLVSLCSEDSKSPSTPVSSLLSPIRAGTWGWQQNRLRVRASGWAWPAPNEPQGLRRGSQH